MMEAEEAHWVGFRGGGEGQEGVEWEGRLERCMGIKTGR